VKRRAADDHLKTLAVRRHLRYLLVYTTNQIRITARQQSVLDTHTDTES